MSWAEGLDRIVLMGGGGGELIIDIREGEWKRKILQFLDFQRLASLDYVLQQ